MKTNNRVCALLGMEFPIIQAGMVWCSGWELASAVSGAGGLGILGAGSMYPQVLRDHIQRSKTPSPASLLRSTSAPLPRCGRAHGEHCGARRADRVHKRRQSGNLDGPSARAWHQGDPRGQQREVCPQSPKRRVDAVVAEGFEAGGHNGREETTTMCLVPAVADACDIPVIAAGGLHDGRSILAAMMLGAEAVQLGSRFVATPESSAHLAFKEAVLRQGKGRPAWS